MSDYYGICPECKNTLQPVWFTEEEMKTDGFGLYHKTGRKRRAVDYLICDCCGHKETVDDTFDGSWYK